MIVVLHGSPGDASAMRPFEIPAFRDTIWIPAVAVMGADEALSAGFNPMRHGLPVTNWELIYRFKYHDGSNYHYQLTEMN